jgi:hypothetical protein
VRISSDLLGVKFHLGVFPISGVHNGGAANLCYLFTVAVKTPAAYFCGADDVFDEKHSATESQREFVEQLDVLQQIIVRGAR